jgi:hypothetical protein
MSAVVRHRSLGARPWFGILSYCAVTLAARAAVAQPSVDAVELPLSTAAKHCLGKPAKTPSELQARASCLSYEAESGIVELMRTLARLDLNNAREQAEWATAKVFEAEVKGRDRAARALEAMVRRPTTADLPEQRVTMIALASLTQRRQERARDDGNGKRPRMTPPVACAERVNDNDETLALEAIACVGKSNDSWPDDALVLAATSHESGAVRHHALSLLQREPQLPEALSRQLAAYLIAQHRARGEFRDAGDVCRVLTRTTGGAARWASLAAAPWADSACRALQARPRPGSPEPLRQFQASVTGGKGVCRTARTSAQDYALLCAFDGTGDAAASTFGELSFQKSELSRGGVSENTYRVPLLSGERLESAEVRSYLLPDRRAPGAPWVDVPRGLVVAPITDRYRGTRRLAVYAMKYAESLELVWQSPECRSEGCRLDIVQREQPKLHDLTGVMLLSDDRAIELDLKLLLEGQLDAALGCPPLLGPLDSCRALAQRAPTVAR